MDTVVQLAEQRKPNPTGQAAWAHRPEPLRVLVTKLHPPPVRDQTVARDRLVAELRAGSDAKLTLLAAPAGYGKTTLLAMWRELEEPTKPVAWLTLDDGDNEPVVLWSYVIAALRGACPGLGTSLSPEMVGPSGIVDTLLPQLVNDLVDAGDVALVLDDFHHLKSSEARETVDWFIANAPSTCRPVLATRSEPALPLAALRAHGELLEMRAEKLGFTLDEAETLLNDRLDLGMDREYINDLVERTEGWPAGLYLAALSLRGAEDRNGYASRFGGQSRHVADFLVDEVLDAHEPRLQALMLRSAVLEQMSGPLCDAVLEQEGSGTLLDSLVRTNLFLVPVDHRGEWYRFHRLYAQLLRAELEHREPGLAPTLHERAYAWHRDHGSPDSAIEHALEAGLFAEAGKLIATAWADYASAGRHATVLAWLDRLPCPLRESPRLLLVEAWVLALSGRVEEASRAIAAVEQAGTPDDGSLPDGFGSVEASLATLRGVAVWSDVDRGLEHARRAAELEGPDSPWRATICWALGAGHYLRGELDDADRWLRESVDSALSTDARLDAASSLALRSLVAGEARRVDMQLELAERAWKLAHERGFFAVDGEVHVAKGQSLVARGRLEEALPYFERGVAALKSRGRPLGVAMALLRQATLIRALRERGRATAVLAEARSIVDACPGPGRLLVEQLAALDSPSRTRSCLRNAELSKRELAILRMLNGPLSERDIGRELYLSQNTVHSHTKSIYRKLGVSSRTEALERAVELGLTKH